MINTASAIMLGQRTSRLVPPPVRWIQSVWGCRDIHARQKWPIFWRYLREFSGRRMRVLDAGCGDGSWTLELAARCPSWSLVGVDLDTSAIEKARSSATTLGLEACQFIDADFFEYAAEDSFDLILSVASAHYAADKGQGRSLFERFAQWLKPGGRLILLGPRSEGETPYLASLPRPPGRKVFTETQLRELCAAAGLEVECLTPRIGRLGGLAKQLQIIFDRLPSLVGNGLLYPLTLLMAFADSVVGRRKLRRSVFWLLIAHKPALARGGNNS